MEKGKSLNSVLSERQTWALELHFTEVTVFLRKSNLKWSSSRNLGSIQLENLKHLKEKPFEGKTEKVQYHRLNGVLALIGSGTIPINGI